MKECFCLEKVHGTSASLRFLTKNIPLEDNSYSGTITFFAGGENHEKFLALFDQVSLLNKFIELGHKEVIIFGEAYGGKQQGMKATYGPDLKFICFDVRINNTWLDVPDAEEVAKTLELEFVPYEKVSTNLEELDRQRDLPSEVAARRGMGLDKIREGIVIRPLTEMTDKRGNRIIAKHKCAAFSERATPQKVVDPSKLVVLKEAQAVADEWVTPNRMKNAQSHFSDSEWDISNLGKIIKYIQEDIFREGSGEIVQNPDLYKAIARKTAEVFKSILIK